MNEKKLNWEDLKLFLAVARSGGLSAAVKGTGKSAPTLARRMLDLEAATASELFERQARGYELTIQGRALLEKVSAIETNIQALAAEQSGGIPTIKISAGIWMSKAICQQVHLLTNAENTARLRFIAQNDILDIARRETIIGIRNHRPEQAQLAVRKIGRVSFAAYSSDKKNTRWIRASGNTPSAQWLAAREDNNCALEVTNPTNAMDLAIAGVGRAVLPTFIGDRQATLHRVSATIKELDHDQWLVCHQSERHKPVVRHVIDQLYTLCRQITQPA